MRSRASRVREPAEISDRAIAELGIRGAGVELAICASVPVPAVGTLIARLHLSDLQKLSSLPHLIDPHERQEMGCL